MAAACPKMPQAEDGHVVFRAQQIDIPGCVGCVGLAVAIDGDLIALVNDRHLNGRVAAGRFEGVGSLVGLGPREAIAAGHPFAGFPFAEDDGVELIALLNGQRAAASLAVLARVTQDTSVLSVPAASRPERASAAKPIVRVAIKVFIVAPFIQFGAKLRIR